MSNNSSLPMIRRWFRDSIGTVRIYVKGEGWANVTEKVALKLIRKNQATFSPK